MGEDCTTFAQDSVQTTCMGVFGHALEYVSSQSQNTFDQFSAKDGLIIIFVFMVLAFTVTYTTFALVVHSCIMQRSHEGIILFSTLAVLYIVMRSSRESMTCSEQRGTTLTVGFNHVYRLLKNALMFMAQLSFVMQHFIAVTCSLSLTAVYVYVLLQWPKQVVILSTAGSVLHLLAYIVDFTHRYCKQLFVPREVRSVYMLFPKSDGHSDQFGTCSSKVPPSWDPSWDRLYPFHTFMQDTLLWSHGVCELDDHQRGPAVAMRLQGVAREVVRELNMAVLMHGHMIPDPNAPVVQGAQAPLVFQSGLDYLFTTLRNRFGMLPQETAIQGISEFLMFARNRNESTDQTISRFEIMRHRAFNNGGLTVSETGCAWMLMMILHIPIDKWPILLTPFEGALPSTRAQYGQFLLYLRRNGHLYDKSASSIKHPYFMHGQEQHEQTTSQMYPAIPGAGTGGHADDNYDDTMSMSSGQSDDDEDIDWTDVQGMNNDEMGERLYVQYRHAKRRWRNFSTSGPKRHFRRFRRKGKGKGKFW